MIVDPPGLDAMDPTIRAYIEANFDDDGYAPAMKSVVQAYAMAAESVGLTLAESTATPTLVTLKSSLDAAVAARLARDPNGNVVRDVRGRPT